MPDLLPFGRAGFAMDLVVLVMLAVLPLQAWSIHLVRRRRAFARHRRVQIALVACLGVAIVLFEIDVRLHGWREAARPSPFYDTLLMPVLGVHIVIAVSTVLLLAVTLVHGLRRFGPEPRPGPASRRHRRLGWCSVVLLGLTAVSGWLFYVLAFIC